MLDFENFYFPPCSTELAAEILERKFKVCKDWQDGLRALKSIYAMNIQRDIAEEAKLRLYRMYIKRYPDLPAIAVLKAAQIVEKNIVSRVKKDMNDLENEIYYDDLIDAAEAAFDEYLAECTADYSELCSVRAQSRKKL